eukprot:gnl/Ergobibamus_cyprinoides/5681.p3 GENE.gnl/Ergobibamus_cyprinoides/5681~~gnl/Ergobibamus_cyprinoides/5681.p3  ORF type:complete len:107 (-),score=4.11 gnl/Ergobibamus_cyprinoides/5681:171-491(-)
MGVMGFWVRSVDGGAGVGLGAVGDAEDLLHDLSTVVETVLTGTGDGVLDTARVPGTNAGDLAETTAGLAGKAGSAPTGGDTLETLTLVDGWACPPWQQWCAGGWRG